MEERSSPGRTPVLELVEDNVVRAPREATLIEVAEILRTAEVGAVVLGDGTRPVGIVSERDLARSIAECRDPSTTRGIDVGQGSIVWCDASATVAEVAAEMMEHYVRPILVENDGELIGVVSARDLLGVYASAEDVSV